MNNDQKTSLIAGIDDATKCPCIGSIFVAGVIATEDAVQKWQELGVKDSKLVAPKKREALAEIIKETALGYVIQDIPPRVIDDKSFNLNEWEMLTVLNIVQKLVRFGNPEKMYVDNWETSEKGFHHRLKTLTDVSLKAMLLEKKIRLDRKKIAIANFIPEHRADENYVVVGAASILAKTASDAQYRKYKKIYGDFGSGSPADPKTRLFVWQHRLNPLPIIRTSWNTYKTLSVLETIEDDPLYARIKMRSEIT